jgi:hypothetical protein
MPPFRAQSSGAGLATEVAGPRIKQDGSPVLVRPAHLPAHTAWPAELRNDPSSSQPERDTALVAGGPSSWQLFLLGLASLGVVNAGQVVRPAPRVMERGAGAISLPPWLVLKQQLLDRPVVWNPTERELIAAHGELRSAAACAALYRSIRRWRAPPRCC